MSQVMQFSYQSMKNYSSSQSDSNYHDNLEAFPLRKSPPTQNFSSAPSLMDSIRNFVTTDIRALSVFHSKVSLLEQYSVEFT